MKADSTPATQAQKGVASVIGSIAKIKMAVGVDGRKNFKGRLQGVADSKMVEIEVDGEVFSLPYADIARANLIGEL